MSTTSLRHLFKNLKFEQKKQEELLKLLTQERASIVHLKQEELDAVVLEKEVLLKSIGENRNLRESIFEELLDGQSVSRKDFTLKPFVENIPEATFKAEFASLIEELETTTTAVRNLSEDNAKILKQSLGLVSSSLAIMRSRPQTNHSSYSRSGTVDGDDENLSKLGSPISSFNKPV